MAQYKRYEVCTEMVSTGLVPVFYNKDFDICKKIIKACVEGGVRTIEFTNRGDLAYKVFAEIIEWARSDLPQLMLGVGSVVDAPTAGIYINSGTNFVVGPVLNSEVARVCNRRKISYSPGCGSLSEISNAEELGVEIVKIFPAKEVGGPAFIKNALGPCPWSSIMPTGGVDTSEENISSWIKAGAACLGMGSKLISEERIEKNKYAEITEEVKKCIGFIKAARS